MKFQKAQIRIICKANVKEYIIILFSITICNKNLNHYDVYGTVIPSSTKFAKHSQIKLFYLHFVMYPFD